MSHFKAPAQYPDINLVRDPNVANTWLARSWTMTILRDDYPLDLSGSTLTISVLDNDGQKNLLTVDASDAVDGVLGATITNDVIKNLGHYSTWQLYETSLYNDVLIQGRFVKQL